jgi:hypothetical protein
MKIIMSSIRWPTSRESLLRQPAARARNGLRGGRFDSLYLSSSPLRLFKQRCHSPEIYCWCFQPALERPLCNGPKLENKTIRTIWIDDVWFSYYAPTWSTAHCDIRPGYLLFQHRTGPRWWPMQIVIHQHRLRSDNLHSNFHSPLPRLPSHERCTTYHILMDGGSRLWGENWGLIVKCINNRPTTTSAA